VQDNSGKNTENTRVDLADDLVRDQRETDTPPPPPSSLRIENAEILAREGMLESAKKILRDILREDPTQYQAKTLLKSIQDQELESILKSQVTRDPIKEIRDSGEDILHELRQDLNLNTFDQTLDNIKNPKTNSMPRLHFKTESKSARDHLEYGIGLLEMQLYDQAIEEFKKVVSNPGTSTNTELTKHSALHLLGLSLFLSKNYSSAISVLEPNSTPLDSSLNVDDEVPPILRIHNFYLLGRCYEAVGKTIQARMWYEQVSVISKTYRDVKERLGRI
jgi:tetratricopeptide (TPR) repeat protein